MKPIIGITSRHADPEWIARNVQRYVDAVRAAGGEPVILAPETHTPAAVDDIDGLLLSGGGDIDPGAYGEQLEGSDEIDPARDALEFGLARAALARDLPVLGVCRGFQVLNVVFGGKLIQHVEGHRGEYVLPDRRADNPHDVQVDAGSRLGRLLGGEEVVVNSFHHQVVTPACLGSGLVVNARHADIVEGFEAPGHRWVLGVQWHPERYAIDGHVFSAAHDQSRLFADFVQAATSGDRFSVSGSQAAEGGHG